MNKKVALITGATAGIGEAAALKLAQAGYDLIVTGRRKERLNRVASQAKQAFGVEVLELEMDVRNVDSVQTGISSIPTEWSKRLELLVNNAGLAAGLSTIQEGSLQDWEDMIDTNLKGLLYVSRAVIPILISNQSGHIINIGSIAGKETYLKGNVYCATKHAVDSLTKAMRIDLLPHRIKVTGIHPGAVETEFSLVRYKGDTEKAKAVYQGFQPLLAEDVAEAILFAATRPAHVNINDLIITPTAQANTSHMLRDE